MVVPEGFAYRIPEIFSDAEAAPAALCGGYRLPSLRLSGLQDGQTLGLTGFGALGTSGAEDGQSIASRTAVSFVFSRTEAERTFARELGATWAGDTSEPAPTPTARHHRHDAGLDGRWSRR